MLRLLFAPLLLLTLAGCDSDSLETIPEADRTIELHFQSFFTGQRAVVEIDGYRVFDGSLTTDNRLSLAEIAEVEVASGSQRLTVEVGGYSAATTFDVGDAPVFIGIRFQAPIEDPPLEFIGVRLEVTEEPYLYY